MNWVGKHRLTPSLICLALLAGMTAGQGEPAGPRPADMRAPAPSVQGPAGPAPQGQVPAKPAEAAQSPNATGVASPSQLSGQQKNATAPSADTTPAAAAPAAEPPKKGKEKKKASAPARETALSNDPTPSFQPETYSATAQAVQRYSQIVEAGSWPTISKPLNPGVKGKEGAGVRQRPAAEGGLEKSDAAGGEGGPGLTPPGKRLPVPYGPKRNGG